MSHRLSRSVVPLPHKNSYRQNPLDYALCPSSGCISVSHLHCLAKDFRKVNSPPTDLIPRGGNCNSCGSYVLWGDIIRGCYRRQRGGVVLESEVDAEEDEESGSSEDVDPQPSQGRKRGRKPKIKASQPAEGSEHESFDLDAISSCEESDGDSPEPRPSMPRIRAPRGRPKKSASSGRGDVAGSSRPAKRGSYISTLSRGYTKLTRELQPRKPPGQLHSFILKHLSLWM